MSEEQKEFLVRYGFVTVAAFVIVVAPKPVAMWTAIVLAYVTICTAANLIARGRG